MLIDRVFSFVLAVPPLLGAAGAWLLYMRKNSIAVPQVPRWRQTVITFGLVFLTFNVSLSFGYLLYELLARTIEWSVFDYCSSAGATACMVGILGGAFGKGALRLLLVLGSLGGTLFWYLTISPSPVIKFVNH